MTERRIATSTHTSLVKKFQRCRLLVTAFPTPSSAPALTGASRYEFLQL
jgi:hypothetical protein